MWKKNKTTFIPKQGKDLSIANSLRQITIGSLMARLFSADSARSLTCRTNNVASETVEAVINLTILKDGINRAKRGSSRVMVTVDIAKAFDLSHVAIFRSLDNQGLHPHAIKLIMEQYKAS
jgi:hypothetical protein